MRTLPRNLALLLSLAVVATFACSKTQDTAPERRIFGEPPTIVSVDPDFVEPQHETQCDFTEIVLALFCQFGYLDMEPQTGTGWWIVPGDPTFHHTATPSTVPGVIIDAIYTEINFKAKVVDPNSTTGNNNILLVSSSFITPESTVETSLVLFDDGSQNNFPVEQKTPAVQEACTVDIPSATCSCDSARYNIQSGDQVKGDDLYTRRFVILSRTTSGFLEDCIMRSRNVIGVPADPQSTYEFKIEAVDRQGNLAAWPNKLVAVSDESRFACAGDSCGCCLLHGFSQQTDLRNCKGEPGMLSPSSFPNGFCIDGIE